MSEVVRSAKRQKLSNGSIQHAPSTSSRLFAPYRTVGLVSSTSVPFTSIALGKTTFQITTSVGHSLQTYDLRKGLHLSFITRPSTPELITASVAWKDVVLAAWGGPAQDSPRGIWVFKRGKQVDELEIPQNLDDNVTQLLVVGAWIVGVTSSKILVWQTATFQLHTTLQGLSPIPFTTSIANLPTLLNKIIIGRQDGTCEIWNISSGKLLYSILPPSTAVGAVTALEPTPALSLAAIAYEDGTVLIHDVQLDQTVLSFNTGPGNAATSISFRTDGLGAGDDGQKAGTMVTASNLSGDVTIWDLNDGGKKAGVLRAAHAQPSATSRGGISKAAFLSGQAILISSGLDNSLKTWIFDESPFRVIPRILHQRSGHGAPITSLHFLPTPSDGAEDTGKWLVSGSNDRSLWGWSLRRDGQSSELSQGAVQSKAKKKGLLSSSYQDAYQDLKCPPVFDIACSLNRDGGIGALPGKQPIWQNSKAKSDAEVSAMTGWESVVTAHENDSKARTWFWGRRRAGRWALPTADDGKVSSVAMSPCGTFALVGSSKGGIIMYNLQSGQYRQHFPARLTQMQAKQLRLDIAKERLQEEIEGKKVFYRGRGRHSDAVIGIGVDELNSVVTSADSGGKVKFWSFQTGLLLHEIDWSLLGIQLLKMNMHRRANLVALTSSDHTIRIVDISTHRLVRELRLSPIIIDGLAGAPLVNCVISDDARWLVASIAQIVLVWDLPTGHLIDAMKLQNTCAGLSLSPTGEFLATASEDSIGVEVFSNRSLFTYTATKQLSEETLLDILAAQPTTSSASGENGQGLITQAENLDLDDDEDLVLGDASNLDKLTADMVSLSVVPKSRWQNLLHLDLIRQRNKPVEAPKKPEKAPFFLPSLQQKPQAETTPFTNGDVNTEKSKVNRRMDDQSRSVFTKQLHAGFQQGEFDDFFNLFKTLGPAEADIEIRSLSVLDNELVAFVTALIWLARQHKDYELGQAWMAVFLRIHGDVVRGNNTLRDAIKAWSVESKQESQRVHKVAEYCGGLVSYLRAARV